MGISLSHIRDLRFTYFPINLRFIPNLIFYYVYITLHYGNLIVSQLSIMFLREHTEGVVTGEQGNFQLLPYYDASKTEKAEGDINWNRMCTI